ncbi:F-box domain-containing protein [Mycena indigotica]|uniref:F-box domain-containing protein n=1 Tax=Mycena indigotica TaxID=2126181 RepID=A0A8H6SG38_9AGAR|nr:F-box domain-containing protein [Mycena indigotica]KAF7298918.1 F-box domain-containing protein [Mycena indigotica]
MILNLPNDVLILLLRQLSVPDLNAVCQTCQFLHALVEEYGWSGYLRLNPRPSKSLVKHRQMWSAKAAAIHDFLSDNSWSRAQFVARPLSDSWPAKQQPAIALDSERLVVATHNTLYTYSFPQGTSPSISLEGSCNLRNPEDNNNYVTALDMLPNGSICVAFYDGTCEYIRILANSTNSTLNIERSPLPSHFRDNKDFVESLSTSSSRILSLSSKGRVVLTDTTALSTSLELNARSWTCHMCLESSSPFAAFGMSSSKPLVVHSISDTELSPQPTAILSLSGSKAPISTLNAVYAITRGPPCSWGGSPQITVAGWYNGIVSVHDLRSSSRDNSSGPPHLKPVLTLSNSWSDDPIYSVACGGGGGNHVAAGAARHSLVSLWDVRNPNGGFNVHAPLNDRSPVYALLMESSRLYGATESRPFVLDFGPGVTEASYPRLSTQPLRNHSSIGFYVTSYPHR